MKKFTFRLVEWYGRHPSAAVLQSTISTEKEAKAEYNGDTAIRKLAEGAATMTDLLDRCLCVDQDLLEIWLLKRNREMHILFQTEHDLMASECQGVKLELVPSMAVQEDSTLVMGGLLDQMYVSSQYPDTLVARLANAPEGSGLKITLRKISGLDNHTQTLESCERAAILAKKFDTYEWSKQDTEGSQGNVVFYGKQWSKSSGKGGSVSISQWSNLHDYSEEYVARILRNSQRLVMAEFRVFGLHPSLICNELSRSKSPFHPFPLNFELENKVPTLPLRPHEFPEDDYQDLKDFFSPASIERFRSAYTVDLMGILLSLSPTDLPGVKYVWEPSFSMNAVTSNMQAPSFKIGEVYGKGIARCDFSLPISLLSEHVFITGKTGTGKTNTAKHIIEQLADDCCMIVIESAKNEYDDWATAHSLSHYVPANRSYPQIRFPLFELPLEELEGGFRTKIPVADHIGGLWRVISSAFPLEGPMIPLLKRALFKVYEHCGWRSRGPDADYYMDPGLPVFPSVSDLCSIIASLIDELGYVGDVRSNIEAALINRLNDLTVGPRRDIFDENSHGISIIDLLSNADHSNSAVICLDNLESDEDKTLALGTFLLRLREVARLEGICQNQLKRLIVIEEAHRLIPNIDHSGLINPSVARSREEAVSSFNDAISEMRSYGVGFMIIDQSPSRISIDVMRNVGTKIVHSVQEEDDRNAACSVLGEENETGRYLVGMERGHALVHTRGMQRSALVRVHKYECRDVVRNCPDTGYVTEVRREHTREQALTELLVELITSRTVDVTRDMSLDSWRRVFATAYSEYGLIDNETPLSQWSAMVSGTRARGLSAEQCEGCSLRCRIPVIARILVARDNDSKEDPVRGCYTARDTAAALVTLTAQSRRWDGEEQLPLRQVILHLINNCVINPYTESGRTARTLLTDGQITMLSDAFERCIALHANAEIRLRSIIRSAESSVAHERLGTASNVTHIIQAVRDGSQMIAQSISKSQQSDAELFTVLSTSVSGAIRDSTAQFEGALRSASAEHAALILDSTESLKVALQESNRDMKEQLNSSIETHRKADADRSSAISSGIELLNASLTKALEEGAERNVNVVSELGNKIDLFASNARTAAIVAVTLVAILMTVGGVVVAILK